MGLDSHLDDPSTVVPREGSSLPPCLAGPAERRGFWDASSLAMTPASTWRRVGVADPVEVFGTAAAGPRDECERSNRPDAASRCERQPYL